MNIKAIPEAELKRDLKDSRDDIMTCLDALAQGITEYSGGLVRSRLDDNQSFVKLITTELLRRQRHEI